MTVHSEDWLASAACRRGSGADDDAAPRVRFSDLESRQKRELAGFALAAVATCTFLLMPLLLVSDETVERELSLPAGTMAKSIAPPAPPQVAGATTIPEPGLKRRAPVRKASRARAPRKAPLPALLAGGRTIPAVVTLADAREGMARPDRRASRGLVSRVLLGDGRHRVRPFPVPSAVED